MNPNTHGKDGPATQCSGDRRIPGAHCSASLGELASARVRETLSQNLWEKEIEEDAQSITLRSPHTHTLSHTCAHSPMRVCTHTHMYAYMRPLHIHM